MNPQQESSVPSSPAQPQTPQARAPASSAGSYHDAGIPLSAFAAQAPTAAPTPVPPQPQPAAVAPAPQAPVPAPPSVQPAPVAPLPETPVAPPPDPPAPVPAPLPSPAAMPPSPGGVITPGGAQPLPMAPVVPPPSSPTVISPQGAVAVPGQVAGAQQVTGMIPSVTEDPMELSANSQQLRGVAKLRMLNVLLYLAIFCVAAAAVVGGWLIYKHLVGPST